MKQIHKEKLQQALPTYCKQIGILPDEMPQLITDRMQMEKIIEERKYDNYSSLKGNYGICYNKLRIIYVNTNKRVQWNKRYSHVRYSDRYLRRHKTTYRDYLETMVHELIHYRFTYLKHGAKYEQRVREILRGKVFPQKQLYPEATKAENNAIVANNNIPTPTASASVPVVRQELVTNYI